MDINACNWKHCFDRFLNVFRFCMHHSTNPERTLMHAKIFFPCRFFCMQLLPVLFFQLALASNHQSALLPEVADLMGLLEVGGISDTDLRLWISEAKQDAFVTLTNGIAADQPDRQESVLDEVRRILDSHSNPVVVKLLRLIEYLINKRLLPYKDEDGHVLSPEQLSPAPSFYHYMHILDTGIVNAFDRLNFTPNPSPENFRQMVDWLNAFPSLCEHMYDSLRAVSAAPPSPVKHRLLMDMLHLWLILMDNDDSLPMTIARRKFDRLVLALNDKHWERPEFAKILSLLSINENSESPNDDLQTLLMAIYRAMLTDEFRHHARLEAFAESASKLPQERTEAYMRELAYLIDKVFAYASGPVSETDILTLVEAVERDLKLPSPRFSWLEQIWESRRYPQPRYPADMIALPRHLVPKEAEEE